MTKLIALLIVASFVPPVFAFELDLMIGRSKVISTAKEAQDDIGGEKQETDEALAPKPVPGERAEAIAVIARDDDKAEIIAKALTNQYCKARPCKRKPSVKVFHARPSDRMVMEALVSAWRREDTVVGIDLGLEIGHASSIMIDRLKESGAKVHGIAFTDGGFSKNIPGVEPMDFCKADGGPGCGGN